MHDLDVVGWRIRLELVLEHDGDVQLAGGQPGEGRPTVDELVADDLRLLTDQVRVAVLQHRCDLGGQIDQCGEEGSETDVAAAQAGEISDLRLSQRKPAEDGLGMLGQQPARLGSEDSATAAADQLGTGLALQQGNLPRHRGLGQLQRVAGS
jgi:hypothetical protein